jgi:hypothetical protein
MSPFRRERECSLKTERTSQRPKSLEQLVSYKEPVWLLKESVTQLSCGQTMMNGEFDPGSGRTLAACLIHASRAGEADHPFGGGWWNQRRTGE